MRADDAQRPGQTGFRGRLPVMANPRSSESPPAVGGAPRRRHGDGTVRATKSGTFEVRWREPDPDRKGQTRRRSRNVTTEADAAQLLAEIAMAHRAEDGLDDLYDLVTGRVAPADAEVKEVAPGAVFDWSAYRAADETRVNFMFLVQEFIRDRLAKSRAPKTLGQYRDLWKRVYRHIGAQHPDDLTVHSADDFLTYLGQLGETDSTVNAIRGFLSSVCNFAVAKEFGATRSSRTWIVHEGPRGLVESSGP